MNSSRYWQLVLATLCLLLLLLGLLHQANGLEVRICNLDDTRLPRRVLPQHYNLDVHLSPSSDAFHGEVEIDISLNVQSASGSSSVLGTIRKKLLSDALRIILHADKSIQIHAVSFFELKEGRKSKEHEVNLIWRDLDKGLVRIDLVKRPRSFLGQLKFTFSGVVKKQPGGIFTLSTSERHLITTQFDPAMARKAFPCFDEPDLKATFDVTIELPCALTALSNMQQSSMIDQEDKRPPPGFKRIRFNRTPEMPAYLLAFVVGEFGHIQAESNGVQLNMWTAPGMDQQAQTRLQIAAGAQAALQDYFQFQQPPRKVDFVAVDLVLATMESWGIVAYNSALIADYKNVNPEKSYLFAVSVTSELARSWLSILATMNWWDDKWLNDGLASWVSRVVLSKMLPDYDPQMFYLLTTMMKTLDADSTSPGSRRRPIKSLEPQTVEDIYASIDADVYRKAECVINMLANYLGKRLFQRGIRNYLSQNLRGSAAPGSLWDFLEQESGINVPRLMHSWIHQDKYPIVTVELLSSRKTYQLVMKQAEFVSSNPQDHLWSIPMIILISGDEPGKLGKVKFVLCDREDSVKLPPWFDPAEHWIKLNSNFQGYYRVQYDDQQLLDALERAVKSKEMPPADRLNLIDEAQALLKARFISEQRFNEMISWFSDEDDDGVILGLVRVLKSIVTQEENLGPGILLRYYEQKGRLRFNHEDSQLRVKARADVLQYLVLNAQEASVMSACYKMYRHLTGKGQPVPGPFRHSMYASVAVICTDAELAQLIEQMDQIEDRQHRSIAANSVWNLLQMKNYQRFLKFSPQIWPYVELR